MKKNSLFILSSILVLSLSSCGTSFLEGMAMALEGAAYGFNNYNTISSGSPTYDYSTSYGTGYDSYASNYSTPTTSSDIQFPDALNPYRIAEMSKPVYTTDANGNLMVSYPGAAQALGEMNNAVQSQINSTINTLNASGDPYSSYTIQSLNAQGYSHNRFTQWEQQYLSTPQYVVDESTATSTSSYSSGTTQSTAKERTQEYGSRYTQKDCRSCLGQKKCNTCNGKGWFYPTASSTSTDCPNCTNGNCSVCNGSGKVIGIK
ncbi:MAG: hypothetical protein Q4F47_08050 [Bacteroidaceae bacterium]|nr:hypothetical protein [Bacteroidaceae bacterium]